MKKILLATLALSLGTSMLSGCDDSDKGGATSTFSDLQDQIKSLQGQLYKQTNDRNELQASIAALGQAVDSKPSVDPQSIKGISERLASLEKTLETKADKSATGSEVENVKSKLAALTQEVQSKPSIDPALIQSISDQLTILEKLIDAKADKPVASQCDDPAFDDSDAINTALTAPSVPSSFPPLVPVPTYGTVSAGQTINLTPDAIILTRGNDIKLPVAANYLQTRLKTATSFQLPINPYSPTSTPCVKLEIKPLKSTDGKQVGPEGYSLVTAKNGAVIRSSTASGLFNGIQTLLQLMPATVYSNTIQTTAWTIPAVKIVDWPRFAYRGSMLDVARRFYAVDEVKRYIDEIALLKINTLHMHLTDDQGWRIAIDELPELTTIGGTTQSGFASKPENLWFYSRAQYNDIVAYAASRFITIVPEIDGPGHSLAAQASIANLNCNNTKHSSYSGFDVGNPTICLDDPAHIDNAKTYLNTVLTSLAALTPGPYIHIGGDEAPGMTPAKMSAYVDAAAAPAAKAKKLLMGWHQIAQGTLPAGSVLQYWGDESYSQTIGTTSEDKNIGEVRSGLAQGAKFVMSPADHAYLDMKYDTTTTYGLTWEGTVSVAKSYDWDPTTKLASVDGNTRLLTDNNVLGVEAPLWTDRAFTNSLSSSLPSGPNPRFVAPTLYTDYMAFPRLASVAEIGWSPYASHSWDDFKIRLGYQGARWDAFGTGYFRAPGIDWKTPSDLFVVNE